MVQRPGTSRTPGEAPSVPTVGLCELTLEAHDLDGMDAFYTRCFGLEVLSREGDRLACGRRTGLGLWAPGPKEFADEGARHVHFAFSAGRGGLAHPRAPARSRRLAQGRRDDRLAGPDRY